MRERLRQGFALLEAGDTRALEVFQHLASLLPDLAEVHFGKGVARALRGEPALAALDFAEAVRLSPSNAAYHRSRARALQESGQNTAAFRSWMKVVSITPRDTVAWNQLAKLASQLRMYEEAGMALQRLIALSPRNRPAHTALGALYQRRGQPLEAERCHRRALEIEPDSIPDLNNLGNLLTYRQKPDEALPLFARATALQPGNDIVAFNQACCRLKAGHVAAARAQLVGLTERHPDHPRIGLVAALAAPILYRTPNERAPERARWLAAVRALGEVHARSSDHTAWLDALHTPFAIHYQGGDMRPLQAVYGALACRIAAPLQPVVTALPPPEDRIRVGFVSAHLRRHTVSKLFGAWIRHLDRERFTVSAYQVAPWTDAETDSLAEACRLERWVMAAPALARRIAAERLHVIIFPEVGLNGEVHKLAAMRLAPVQAMAWGHPITSGMPTMDVFLTSDAMEPPDGEAQYTERLVRLPGLSICYARPELPDAPLDRTALDIPADRPLLLSCQSLFKYPPEQDAAFARVCAALPEAVLVFIAHQSVAVTDAFTERLSAVFSAAGLRLEDCVRVIPRVDEDNYLKLNRDATVYLDSMLWSGGNTTLEAIAAELPVVTLPGDTMRSRHSAAILETMGLGDLVARTIDDWVDLAVRLGNDDAYRAEVTARIRSGSAALWDDHRPIRALERFLEEAVLKGNGLTENGLKENGLTEKDRG